MPSVAHVQVSRAMGDKCRIYGMFAHGELGPADTSPASAVFVTPGTSLVGGREDGRERVSVPVPLPVGLGLGV
jgi:hypothetical protein